MRKVLSAAEGCELSGDVLGDVKIFRSPNAHSDLLHILPARCWLFFFDNTGLTVLRVRVFFFLDEPLEVSVTNQNFNGILQMDAFFGHVTVGLVIPAPFTRILVRLGRYLLRELNPALLEFRGSALGQDMLERRDEISVAREHVGWSSGLPVLITLLLASLPAGRLPGRGI
ncbi:hypothetical protein A2U01_0026093 [Trifolium medium]|uniref:Uncharacterized protein n=1 Tax=Trifolium medium TaxID=97028 RepID=A0A392P007_9FABA|nr:hypothetical protein [Trifolium medium]